MWHKLYSKKLFSFHFLHLHTTDLSVCGVAEEENVSPPIPPDHPNIPTEENLVEQSLSTFIRCGNMVRHGSEHSLVTNSVNLSEVCESNQQYRLRNTSPLRRKSLNQMISTSSSAGKERKYKSLEKNHFRKSKSKKRVESLSGRGSPANSISSSPARNTNMFFSGSPSHTRNMTGSLSLVGGGGSQGSLSGFNSLDSKSSKKSRWTMMRMKMGKPFSRTSNMEEEEASMQGSGRRTQRSHSSASIKKYSIGRSSSITEEDFLNSGSVHGGSISSVAGPRMRKGSITQQGYNLKMMSKIFSILTFWVDEYFEVSVLLIVLFTLFFLGVYEYAEMIINASLKWSEIQLEFLPWNILISSSSFIFYRILRVVKS